MLPTNKLNPVIRYPLAVITAILSGIMFLSLLAGALKLGEWIFNLLTG